MTAVSVRRRSAAAAALIAAGTIAGALGAATPANAGVNRFLAIAFSPATGQWGYTQSLLDANQAKFDAVGYCLNKGGTDCRVVVWGDNECAALATSPNPFNHSLMWGTGVAQTQKEAETKARFSTSFNATVVLSFCSLGTEH